MPASIFIRTIFNHIDRISNNLPQAVDSRVKAWADDGVTVWQDLMFSSPPTGRTYYFDPSGKGRTVPHVASSPGNPPRIWTGEYADSVHAFQMGPGHYGVGSDVDHSVDLELGIGIEPRPVAGPTANIIGPEGESHFQGLEGDLL